MYIFFNNKIVRLLIFNYSLQLLFFIYHDTSTHI